MIDGMPCIVLDNPIRGGPNMFIIRTRTRLAPPIPSDLMSNNTNATSTPEHPLMDFTQLQHEKNKMFMRELLDELKRHGWKFF